MNALLGRCRGLRGPKRSPAQRVRLGEEEQGSVRSFRQLAETEQNGLCDDDVAEIRRINLSLNLSVPHQREAWKVLRAIPARQRTSTVCRMICQAREQESLLEAIRALFREELGRVAFVSETEKQEPTQVGDVDDSVLDFLLGLQREGDDEPSDSLF